MSKLESVLTSQNSSVIRYKTELSLGQVVSESWLT